MVDAEEGNFNAMVNSVQQTRVRKASMKINTQHRVGLVLIVVCYVSSAVGRLGAFSASPRSLAQLTLVLPAPTSVHPPKVWNAAAAANVEGLHFA